MSWIVSNDWFRPTSNQRETYEGIKLYYLIEPNLFSPLPQIPAQIALDGGCQGAVGYQRLGELEQHLVAHAKIRPPGRDT